MKAILVVIVCLLLTVVPVTAQDFDFDDNLSKAEAALDSGQYELAIKYLEPCEKIVSQDTTKEMQEVDYKLLNFMVVTLVRLGNYKKAIEFGTRALDIQKRLFGDNSSDYATSLNNLANYYYYLGDYSKAV
ncbi:MAG: tetratricopeptide repeat protein, partial [Sodaliphilus sp.]|nr:tetratricopeptide repeat protein [Sodaliphilus sp.]